MENTNFLALKTFSDEKRKEFVTYCWKSLKDIARSYGSLGRVIDAAIYSFREDGMHDPEEDTFALRLSMQFQRELGVMMGVFNEDGFTIRGPVLPRFYSEETFFDPMLKHGTLQNPEQASWLFAGFGRIVDTAIYSYREDGMNDPEVHATALCEVLKLQRGIGILLGVMEPDGFTFRPLASLEHEAVK